MSKIFLSIVLVVFFLVSIQFAYSHIKILSQSPAFDFETLYFSGHQALNGQNPYLKLHSDTVRNPPPAILLYSIWALLPIKLSEIVWFILSITIFLIGSYFLIKTLEKENNKFFNSKNILFWLLYLILVLRFFPFRWNVGSGQINNLLFALLCISFYLIRYKKQYLGSVALALGISIKLTPLFILFNFFIQKKFRLVFYTLFNLFTIFCLTILILATKGINIIKDYSSIPNLYFDFYTTNYHNQSLASFLTRLLSNPQASQTISVICLIIGLVIFYIFFRKNTKYDFKSEILSWNISILYMLIFAPFAWKYHFVIIIFPLLTTCFLLYTTIARTKAWIVLVLSYLLISFHFKSGYLLEYFNPIQAVVFSHVLVGAILLLILNFYLVSKEVTGKRTILQ